MKKCSRSAGLGIAVVASAIALVAVPAGAAFATPGTSGDATGTASLTGGALSFTPPTTADFGTTSLTGVDTSASATQAFDVQDARGSANGWNISLTTTTFTNGSVTLPTNALTDTGFSVSCDVDSSGCVPGAGSATPQNLPTDAVDPAIIETAASGTGMGDQTATHSMALAIPAAAIAGTYTPTGLTP
jgi:hypothetical protein